MCKKGWIGQNSNSLKPELLIFDVVYTTHDRHEICIEHSQNVKSCFNHKGIHQVVHIPIAHQFTLTLKRPSALNLEVRNFIVEITYMVKSLLIYSIYQGLN